MFGTGMSTCSPRSENLTANANISISQKAHHEVKDQSISLINSTSQQVEQFPGSYSGYRIVEPSVMNLTFNTCDNADSLLLTNPRQTFRPQTNPPNFHQQTKG